MKKILTFALLLCSICASAQQNDVDFRSIIYQINKSDHNAEQQDLTYTLENGGLRIQGYMYTNCCGLHVMNCLVQVERNRIFLSRADMGDLCDCGFSHKVDIFIDSIPNQDYTIILDAYGCRNGTYDEAKVTATSISQVKEKDYSLQYTKESCILTLSGNNWSKEGDVAVYDSFGIKIWEQEYRGNNIIIPIQVLEGNFCICKITGEQDSSSIKLTKP